jgi:hypothetical protein
VGEEEYKGFGRFWLGLVGERGNIRGFGRYILA